MHQWDFSNSTVIDYWNDEAKQVPLSTLRLLAELGFVQLPEETPHAHSTDTDNDYPASVWYHAEEKVYMELFGNRFNKNGEPFVEKGKADDLEEHLRFREFPVDRILRTRRLKALLA